MLLSLLDMANSNTKITFKKTHNSAPYIEASNGFTFEVKKLLKDDNLFLRDARIACIDGYVESVSELHLLLEELSEAKVPCFLFVRGMSEDVLHTIKTNNDRKTLMVFPYIVPFDLDSVNTIVDIAVSAGTDVLSNLKGQLISSMNLKMTGKVDSISTSNGIITIQNTENHDSIQNHLDNIRNSLNEKNEAILDILKKRINSLTANKIEVCIPDDINFFSMSQQLDEGIRIISSIMNKKFDPELAASRCYDSYESTLNRTFKVFTSN